MAESNFILRFDSREKKLNLTNGLGIHELSELLAALYDAIGVEGKDKIFLTEVKEESQGFALYCADPVVHESLRVVHNKINQNNFANIEDRELKYLRVLKKITDKGIYLEARDNRDFFVRISEVSAFDKKKNIVEYLEVVGTISELGGDKILGRRHVKLDEFEYNIEIDLEQDDQLKYFYKQAKVTCYVRIVKNFDDEKVKGVSLVSFEPKNTMTLKEAISRFLSEKGDVFNDIIDAVPTIRDLRESNEAY